VQRDEIMQRLTRIIADRLGSTGDRSGIVEESCLGRDHELNDAKRDELRAELNKVFGVSLSAEDLSPDAMADMGALADLIRARGAVPVQAGVESGVIRSARAEELGDVLELQRRAFAAVAERVGDMEIAPMVQTMPDIIREFESGIVLVYEQGGRIVGSVRAQVRDSVAHVGRLIVDPRWQHRGIGTRLMRELENRVEGCASYELFTGEEFPELVRLYKALGYRVVGTVLMDAVPMVMMSKQSPAQQHGTRRER